MTKDPAPPLPPPFSPTALLEAPAFLPSLTRPPTRPCLALDTSRNDANVRHVGGRLADQPSPSGGMGGPRSPHCWLAWWSVPPLSRPPHPLCRTHLLANHEMQRRGNKCHGWPVTRCVCLISHTPPPPPCMRRCTSLEASMALQLPAAGRHAPVLRTGISRRPNLPVCHASLRWPAVPSLPPSGTDPFDT